MVAGAYGDDGSVIPLHLIISPLSTYRGLRWCDACCFSPSLYRLILFSLRLLFCNVFWLVPIVVLTASYGNDDISSLNRMLAALSSFYSFLFQTRDPCACARHHFTRVCFESAHILRKRAIAHVIEALIFFQISNHQFYSFFYLLTFFHFPYFLYSFFIIYLWFRQMVYMGNNLHASLISSLRLDISPAILLYLSPASKKVTHRC